MTFNETRSVFYDRALVAAGIATGIGAAVIVAILAWGGWPATQYGQIITILGRALMGAGVLMMAVIAYLGLGGPAKNTSATFGKISVTTEGD